MDAMLARLLDSGMEILPVAVFFVALSLVIKKKAILSAWRKCRRESVTNFFILLIDVALILPIVFFPANWLLAEIGKPAMLVKFWAGMPILVSCLAAVVIGDLVGYWRHRFEHWKPIWPSHAVHHSDEAMNWLTLHRMHPVNRFTTVTIDIGILLLLGLPPVAVFVNGMVRNLWGYFIHADVAWTMGPLGRMFISPAAHRIHHVREEALAGKNFATVFTFWDKIWNTWRDPSDLPDVETGIESGSLNVLGELARPLSALAPAMGLGRLLRSKPATRPVEETSSLGIPQATVPPLIP